MLPSDAVVLGFVLAVLGLGAVILVALASLAIIRRKPFHALAPPKSIALDLEPAENGVILTKAGGRVMYANERARQWFDLNGGEANLEQLARLARPTDLFLELCSAEGKAQLAVGELALEAISHPVPLGADSGMVIILRPQVSRSGQGTGTIPDLTTYQALAEIGQAVTERLRLEEAIQAILRNVRRLIPSDLAEIALLDHDSLALSRYRSSSSRVFGPQAYPAPQTSQVRDGFSGWLLEHHHPLLIPDVDAPLGAPLEVDRRSFPYNAFLGVPLVFGGEPLGTLELASYQPNAYHAGHQSLLELIAVQAAAALHATRLDERQRQRAHELANLSELTQAVGSLKDREALTRRLTQGIARLLRVEMLGILSYDAEAEQLAGQTPFVGIPDPFVERYFRIPVPRESAAWVNWLGTQPWLSNDVENDPEVDAMGLRPLAQAASIRNALVAPMTSGGRRIGVIQAANKQEGRSFDEDDVRLLSILAAQSATMIENAQLLDDARRRAERADGLRQIASLVASTATLDEVLSYALRELARLLGADFACIMLLDETRSSLRPHHASLLGVESDEIVGSLACSAGDAAFDQLACFTLAARLCNQPLDEDDCLPALRNVVKRLAPRSLLDLPLVIQERGIGELLLAKMGGDPWAHQDVQLATTVAGQVAGAIERARLAAQTDETLRRRVDQLTALVHVNRELSLTLDLNHLISQVHEQAVRTTGADGGYTVLLDLAAADGSPHIALHVGQDPPPNDLSAQELEVLRTGRWSLSDEMPPSADAAESPLGARTSLVTPIAFAGQHVGLIRLRSASRGRFDSTSIQIVEGLAIQAAIAIGNTQRYQEQIHRAELLRRRAEALSQIFSISNAIRSDQPLEVSLETIAYGLQAASGFNAVVIGILQPDGTTLRREAAAGLPLHAWEAMRRESLPWQPLAAVLSEDFRVSQTYLIPGPQAPHDLPSLHPIADRRLSSQRADAWRPGDRLLAPILGLDARPIGLISLDDPRNGQQPDRETIETIEIFANQAALAIENTLLYMRAEGRVENLTRQLEGLRESHAAVNRTARELLQQDASQSNELEDLRRRRELQSALMRVVDSARLQADDRGILQSLAENMLRELKLSVVLIAEPTDEELSITVTAGRVPSKTKLPVLLGQHNPLPVAWKSGSVPIPNVKEDGLWSASPLLKTLRATSALALPISGERAVGAPEAVALLVSTQTAISFDNRDVDLFLSLGRQIGNAMEERRFLSGIEQRLAEGNILLEFSLQLGSLDLAEVMRNLADGLRRAMPATEACLVALWEEDRGALVPYGSSGYPQPGQISQLEFRPGESLLGQAFLRLDPTHWPEIEITRDFNLEADKLETYRRANEGRVPISALAVPLLVGETPLGVVLLENYSGPAAFNESDASFVRSLARQAALTIQNARLYHAAEERARQLETLANVSAALTSSLDSRQVVQSMLMEFGRVLPYDSATLWLREGRFLRVVAAQGFTDDEDRIGLTVRIEDSALYEQMVVNGQPILIPDTSDDLRFPSFPGYPVRSWLGIPLIAREQVVGLLALDNHKLRAYSPHHIEVATTLARQAALALENSQLYDQARRSSETFERRVEDRTGELARAHHRAETLWRITSELSTSLDLDLVLHRALTLVNEAVGADRGAILLASPESDHLVLRASLGQDRPVPTGGRPTRLTRATGLAGWVMQNRQPLILPDLAHDERWISFEDDETFQSAMAIPLVMSDDALGALVLQSRRRNAFDDEQLRLVSAAANQVASAMSNAELFRLIRDQAERLGGMLRNQQVEASKSRAILEAIADGVIVTDTQHEIILFNSAAEQILRLERDHVIGRPVQQFIGMYGPSGKRWAEAVEAWSRRPNQAAVVASLAETLTLDPDRIVEVHVAPVVLRDDFLGTVSIFRDITRSVEVDRLKSEFVGTVSHELRTPMTSIKGYVEILLSDAAGDLNEQQRRFLEIVNENTERLTMLVNDLLDLSRIEAGKVELSFQHLDVGSLLEEAKDLVLRRSQEQSKAMQIVVEASEALPAILGDPDRVRQILFNLVNNSFNYTNPGGRIFVRARRLSGEIAIDVADNGIGIPPGDQVRIFERFFRGEQALNMGVAGTGLGLAIVAQLIEMHGGKIWVVSEGEPGKGSVFTFTLPIARGNDPSPSPKD
ncbi:MAG TPA: GAF domain-containing protein [Anaerolineales bacterium]|nr:GAF domain-containing protein [Anaerolineales bacterium]